MDKSRYWHSKIEMPKKEKETLKSLIYGTPALLINAGYNQISLLKVDARLFKTVFSKNRKYLYMGDLTADPDENNYDNAENYISDDGLAGFSISENHWLVSLFSNRRQGGFLKLTGDFIKNKADKLVFISASRVSDSLLSSYSKNLGFYIAAKTSDDTKIMTEYYGDEFMENFVSYHGNPYHIFMTKTKQQTILEFDHYFDAYNYIDNLNQ